MKRLLTPKESKRTSSPLLNHTHMHHTHTVHESLHCINPIWHLRLIIFLMQSLSHCMCVLSCPSGFGKAEHTELLFLLLAYRIHSVVPFHALVLRSTSRGSHFLSAFVLFVLASFYYTR